MLRVLLVTLATSAVVSPAAHAATASLVVDVSSDGTLAAASYTADAGEVNALRADRSGNTLTFRDTGATITPGEHCTSDGPHAVTCTFAGTAALAPSSIALG